MKRNFDRRGGRPGSGTRSLAIDGWFANLDAAVRKGLHTVALKEGGRITTEQVKAHCRKRGYAVLERDGKLMVSLPKRAA